MAKLYVVGTPIGNLQDISQRALETLKNVDIIACEDTRKSLKLLNHFNISKPLMSYHDHNAKKQTFKIIDLLKEGKNIALISDAGMPLISDPGYPLIQALEAENLNLDVIPGPTALISALILSGMPTDKFVFLGFLPLKTSKISRQLESIKDFQGSVILYESPYRLIKTLNLLKNKVDISLVAVVKEITKIYQTVVKGTIEEVLEKLEKSTIKGEFVIIFSQKINKKN